MKTQTQGRRLEHWDWGGVMNMGWWGGASHTHGGGRVGLGHREGPHTLTLWPFSPGNPGRPSKPRSPCTKRHQLSLESLTLTGPSKSQSWSHHLPWVLCPLEVPEPHPLQSGPIGEMTSSRYLHLLLSIFLMQSLVLGSSLCVNLTFQIYLKRTHYFLEPLAFL